MSVAQEMSTLAKIRTRGYWRVVVRPAFFDAKHVADYSSLFPIVERNSVRLRGWDYPHIDPRRRPEMGTDWVGQDCDWQDEIEVWRLYQSGQFVHYFALAGDWRDRSDLWPTEPGWIWGKHIYYVDTIYSFLEIFEFAARLAQTPAGAPRIHVEIDLNHLKGRRLATEDVNVMLHGDYRTEMPNWKHQRVEAQTELIARPRELAASTARELFARFGLDVSLETISRIQERVGR
jgi:hypothetical protein